VENLKGRKKASQVKIKKLSLCGHDFKKFIKQIDPDDYYLVKLRGMWHVGHIRFVNVGGRTNRDEGHSWSFDLGAYPVQLSYREPNVLDFDWQACYQIIDPDLIAAKAKTLLSKKNENKR
jgi:hypothetical protein